MEVAYTAADIDQIEHEGQASRSAWDADAYSPRRFCARALS
jgi:hypothetical protein